MSLTHFQLNLVTKKKKNAKALGIEPIWASHSIEREWIHSKGNKKSMIRDDYNSKFSMSFYRIYILNCQMTR